ncbi:hypothetical protein MCOR12_011830 [Pyricularia oryzae]|nr:hypothetical protein MCOR12_011830 [Pyricularia oryzae]
MASPEVSNRRARPQSTPQALPQGQAEWGHISLDTRTANAPEPAGRGRYSSLPALAIKTLQQELENVETVGSWLEEVFAAKFESLQAPEDAAFRRIVLELDDVISGWFLSRTLPEKERSRSPSRSPTSSSERRSILITRTGTASSASKGRGTPINKSVTWAERAATPPAAAPTQILTPATRSYPIRTTPGNAPDSSATPSQSGRDRSQTPKRLTKQPSNRILIRVNDKLRMVTREPYAVTTKLAELVSVPHNEIPNAKRTPTGWGVTVASKETRQKILNPSAVKAIMDALDAREITVPTTWHIYAVSGMPRTLNCLDGRKDVHEVIQEEITVAAGQQPVNWHISKHGYDPHTAEGTWIISFLQPVKPFQLFGMSKRARKVEKSRKITHHHDGCQGYCEIRRCVRQARCGIYGEAKHATEEEPCKAAPKCVNCHGHFPSGYKNCPARPLMVNGKFERPLQRKLKGIRKIGRANRAAIINDRAEAARRKPAPAIPVLNTLSQHSQTSSSRSSILNKRARPCEAAGADIRNFLQAEQERVYDEIGWAAEMEEDAAAAEPCPADVIDLEATHRLI